MVRPKSWCIVVQLKRVATRLSRAADCSRNLLETGFVYLIYEPTLKSKACLKCLYFTKIISDLCRYLECFSYLYAINQTE